VALRVTGCSLAYTCISYLGGWFGRDLLTTGIYFVFMLICYGCVFWFYSVRRRICTRQMNQELEAFKRKKQNNGGYPTDC